MRGCAGARAKNDQSVARFYTPFYNPRLWPLHMVWHLLSCLGGVFAIVHNAFLRKEKLRSPHSHSPPPFVHAAAAPTPSGDSGTMTATEAGDAGRSGGDSGT